MCRWQHFQHGTRHVTARSIPCYHHPNVLFLIVCPSKFSWFFKLLRFLPTTWQTWLESYHPEWFLPDRIVMKREKADWAEEFDNEKAIYQVLAPVQGIFVPKCYGEVKCPKTPRTGTRALILSYIDGFPLSDEDNAGHLELDHLEDMLWETTAALYDLNVDHDDDTLDNCILAGDRIMFIDFDTSYISESRKEEDREYNIGLSICHLFKTYQAAYGPNAPRKLPRRFKQKPYIPPDPSLYEWPWFPPGTTFGAPGSGDGSSAAS